MPEFFKKGVPSYPKKARRLSKNGLVELQIFIDEEGKPAGAKVYNTTDPNWKYGFNEAALSAVMNCRFKPMLCNGEPLKCSVIFPYEFELRQIR